MRIMHVHGWAWSTEGCSMGACGSHRAACGGRRGVHGADARAKSPEDEMPHWGRGKGRSVGQRRCCSGRHAGCIGSMVLQRRPPAPPSALRRGVLARAGTAARGCARLRLRCRARAGAGPQRPIPSCGGEMRRDTCKRGAGGPCNAWGGRSCACAHLCLWRSQSCCLLEAWLAC
jgi:hypothetical protein